MSASAKLLVLGATGGTGRLIVSQAVARGHDVTVVARSPDKARGLDGARVLLGDARDVDVLRGALAGRDAVISALGTPASPFREVTALSTATRALVDAMRAERVERLVYIYVAYRSQTTIPSCSPPSAFTRSNLVPIADAANRSPR